MDKKGRGQAGLWYPVWAKVHSYGSGGLWVLNVPKIHCCLKCNYKAEKIQSGIRKAWAWSIGWVWGHLGQWEPPYSCAVETENWSVTHTRLHPIQSPTPGPSNLPSWSLPRGGAPWAAEGTGTASILHLSNLQALDSDLRCALGQAEVQSEA